MTRADSYAEFLDCLIGLLSFARAMDIPIRLGEAHRPWWVAEIYAKGDRKLGIKAGTGIIKSRHRYSFAVDLWIINNRGDPLWKDERYIILGEFWEQLGHVWGGRWKRRDIYHFEFVNSVK